MTTIQHSAITGSDAIHPSNFYASADPGAVGPNKDWLDTTTSPPIQKRRNAGDSGWDVILDPSLYQTKSLLTLLGDLPYASAASTWARLAGNTSATKKFLQQTGNGSISAAPSWGALVAGDIPSLAASIITSGTFSTAQIPSLDASKIATGVLGVPIIPGVEPNYYAAHVNGGGGLDIWYALGASTTTSSATAALVANLLYAVPFVAPARGATIDRIAFNVTTLLAGNGRAGIYDATSNTNIYPNNLILDGGGISTGTTGVKSATVSQALTPGKLYWAAYVGDAAATLRTYVANQCPDFLGLDSTLGASPNRGLTVTQTYGALPSTFPAGASTSIGSLPVVYARYSA